ncbi:hypothetical protein RUM44_002583 [Polyplax serrata]|uniref:Uncharacterized protein n=1 Tax=Polyplax serrata TaxID=468196 RepID=A0ABR1AFN9_POLSC
MLAIYTLHLNYELNLMQEKFVSVSNILMNYTTNLDETSPIGNSLLQGTLGLCDISLDNFIHKFAYFSPKTRLLRTEEAVLKGYGKYLEEVKYDMETKSDPPSYNMITIHFSADTSHRVGVPTTLSFTPF